MWKRLPDTPESMNPELSNATVAYRAAFTEYAHGWKFSQVSTENQSELDATESVVIGEATSHIMSIYPGDVNDLIVLMGADEFDRLCFAVDDTVLSSLVSPSADVLDDIIGTINGNLRRRLWPSKTPVFKVSTPSKVISENWSLHQEGRLAEMASIFGQLQDYDPGATTSDAIAKIVPSTASQALDSVEEQMKFLMYAGLPTG